MRLALTRPVSPSLVDCELTFQAREPIQFELAQRQHRAYEAALRSLGLSVVSLPPEPGMPDSAFVEDTCVIVDELAVMSRPALESRRREVAGAVQAITPHRPISYMQAPATLEGGDVLRIGRKVYVGQSTRTNGEGVAQLASYLQPHGYEVVAVPVERCLHLKTAGTYLGRNTLLANSDWVDVDVFKGMSIIQVPATEEWAGNALAVGDVVIMPASFPETRRTLESHGFEVCAVDVSELQKAEAGVTCCSVIFSTTTDRPDRRPPSSPEERTPTEGANLRSRH